MEFSKQSYKNNNPSKKYKLTETFQTSELYIYKRSLKTIFLDKTDYFDHWWTSYTNYMITFFLKITKKKKAKSYSRIRRLKCKLWLECLINDEE